MTRNKRNTNRRLATKIKTAYTSKSENVSKTLFATKYLFFPIIVALVVWGIIYCISTIKVIEAAISLKDYKYLRETPNYRVYEINFILNNNGNQPISLIQAIPYDQSGYKILLLNNHCESYKLNVEGGKLENFSMQAFVPKQDIEVVENFSRNLKIPNIIDTATNKVIIGESYLQAKITAKVFISSNKKLMLATFHPINLQYKRGEEGNASTSDVYVDFKETNEKPHECALKQTFD